VSRLIWTPSALRDVQRLYRFLAEKNRDAAKRAVQAIRSGVQIISFVGISGQLLKATIKHGEVGVSLISSSAFLSVTANVY
jgi:plasmid stabilization system protein ParE